MKAPRKSWGLLHFKELYLKHPIDLYTSAIKQYEQGNLKESSRLLCKSLGSKGTTETIRSNLPKILDPTSLIHKGVIQVLVTEAKKFHAGG